VHQSQITTPKRLALPDRSGGAFSCAIEQSLCAALRSPYDLLGPTMRQKATQAPQSAEETIRPQSHPWAFLGRGEDSFVLEGPPTALQRRSMSFNQIRRTTLS
jgi:hypothetical protein